MLYALVIFYLLPAMIVLGKYAHAHYKFYSEWGWKVESEEVTLMVILAFLPVCNLFCLGSNNSRLQKVVAIPQITMYTLTSIKE